MAKEWLVVKNWDQFQHYKKRNPPWIRFYRSTLVDHELAALSIEARLLANLLWLLASENDGKIKHDASMISFRVHLPVSVVTKALRELIDAKFMAVHKDDASNLRTTLSKLSHSEISVSELSESVDGGVGEGSAEPATEPRQVGAEQPAVPDPVVAKAISLAQEFMFQGSLDDVHRPSFVAEFTDALRVYGLERADGVMEWIKAKERRKREATTPGMMWKFWNHFEWAGSDGTRNRNGLASKNAKGKPTRVCGGGTDQDFGVVGFRVGDGEPPQAATGTNSS